MIHFDRFFTIKILLSCFLFVILNTSSYADTIKNSTPSETLVVVELFTSQSCSSCPPADKLLRTLSDDSNIIALGCHVTYWNYLQWEDTLSKNICNQRQKSYAQSIRKKGSYTPQMVINGHIDVVGNRSRDVKTLIDTAQRNDPIKKIRIEKIQENLNITLPDQDITPNNYTVSLISYGSDYEQSITDGENSGKKISYTNPVIDIIPLENWDGSRKTINFLIDKKITGYAVLVQTPESKIIAAGNIKL